MAAANPTFVTDRGRGPAEAVVILTPALRARIEGMASFLLDLLDAADAVRADMEPDAEGEGAPDEASAQPVTLAPDGRPAVTYRPSRRAMRVAYRRNGDPIPANLRPLAGLFGGQRA